MKTFSFISLLLLCGQTLAADVEFDARVKKGKEVEASPAGRAYHEALFRASGEDTAAILKECFPEKVTGDGVSFTLVADVLPNRTLANVAVQPATPMTQCFEVRFVRLPFPKVPTNFGDKGMPFFLTIRITP